MHAIMHAIISGDGRKQAQLTAGPQQGTHMLILGSPAGGSPHLSVELGELLTCSLGRPWHTAGVQLQDAAVSPDAAGNALQLSAVVNGVLHFDMQLAWNDTGLLKVRAAWTNASGSTLQDAVVGLLFPVTGAIITGGGTASGKANVTIPHMIYNNNPSSDPGRVVPKLGVGPGRGFICEEHRLPIPCVNIEWPQESRDFLEDGSVAGGSRISGAVEPAGRTGQTGASVNADESSRGTAAARSRYFTLYSLPQYTEAEDGRVQYGSLGAIAEEQYTAAAALSGAVMFGGEPDIICIAKGRTEPYSGGYRDLLPGSTLVQEYVLDWGEAAQPGRAYQELVRQGLLLYDTQGAAPLTVEEMLSLKTQALDARWTTGSRGEAGYVKFGPAPDPARPSKHRPHFMYGWTGQCLKLAWCDAEIGLRSGQEYRVERALQAVDFYLQGSRTEIPGLRMGIYHLEEARWDAFRWNGQPVISSRALGETLSDLAELALLLQDHGRELPPGWMEAVQEAARFLTGAALPSGIYPAAWLPDGRPADEMITAAGLPCTVAAAKAYRLCGEPAFLAAAESGMRRYYELHARTFERPFARSTLDARCEDKEAGMYFFLAAYELYLLTRKREYREWAEAAADWILTFVYLWNPVYDAGSAFRERGFAAAGWPGVSVQNHHLDVFFPTYELWHFGRLTGRADYERMGRLSFEAMGQGICTKPGEYGFQVPGEQGEGFFQTNWNGRGHSNTWNPSWVIALVLQNALRFQEEALG